MDDVKTETTGSICRDAAIIAGMIAATIALPVVIHGWLSWLRFDYFSLSSYVPHEAMRAELATPTLAKIASLPLVEINMTSGHILANMYTLTLGQLTLSVALGLVMGLVLARQLHMRALCAMPGRQGVGAAAAAGTGLLATIAAASTGLLGCCGGAALAGGVFALAGLSSATAATLAQASPVIQVALILLFGWLYSRLRFAGVRSSSPFPRRPSLRSE
jgi:hypothetical protein